jgi:Holliday junction resolvase
MTDDQPKDPDRDTTPGRGHGNGTWLERKLQRALQTWGYATERRVPIVAQNADVVAGRRNLADEPSDYLVAECKDWASRPIDESVIIRLCLLAFMARAMPVLCHTSRLTDRAWRLAQAYDVRLLLLEDLDADALPPLTRKRPPADAQTHRQSISPKALRETPPIPLHRLQRDSPDMDLQGPVYLGSETAPCYVPDRTGHEEYRYGEVER